MELPPAGKKDPPVVYAVYRATTAKGDGPFPLILALHAGTKDARQFASFLMPAAEGQGAILVAAQGFREVVGADGFWWKGDVGEQAMLDRLLDHVRKTLPVEPKGLTVVGLFDGAELGIKWALEKDRGVRGVIAVNFLWKPPEAPKAPKGMKFCLIASRDAKDKLASLSEQAEKAGKALAAAGYPVVLRIVPGASRSFSDGWEKEFRNAFQWFDGKLDWPKQLAEAAGAPEK
jgi:pimeloyl-ACP methyl ester carboxylesterase